MQSRLPYVWDYAIDEAQFYEMLTGQIIIGRLDRDWAAVRLIEYAPYKEIIRLLGFGALVQNWPFGATVFVRRAVNVVLTF